MAQRSMMLRRRTSGAVDDQIAQVLRARHELVGPLQVFRPLRRYEHMRDEYGRDFNPAALLPHVVCDGVPHVGVFLLRPRVSRTLGLRS